MQPKNFNYNNIEQEEALDIRLILMRLLSKWYWFVIFAVLGAIMGFVASKLITPQYQVGTTLLINEDTNLSSGDFLFQNEKHNSAVRIDDEVGIISSYTLNLEAVQQLGWTTSWYKKKLFTTSDIYMNSPFEIAKVEGATNLSGIPVHIQHLTEKTFKLHVNETYKDNQLKRHVKYDIIGKYGEPIKNVDFNFIVNKNYTPEETESGQYFFVFNDYILMAQDYQKRLEITFSDEKSNLINVNITGSNPQREADYLNSLSKVYIEFGLNEKNTASENTVRFIDSQLSGIVDSLQQAGRNFTDFRTENRVVDLSQEGGLIMERMREVETAHTLAEMKLRYYENLQKYMGDSKQMEQMVAPSVVGITDPALNGMVKQLGELYNKRNTLVLTVQEKNPSLIALNNEINYTRQSLDENLKNLISNARLELRNLNQTKAEINVQLSKLPKTEQSMVNIKRNFDLNNDLYTFLLQKRAEAAINKAATIPKVKTLDIARVENSELVGSKKTIIVLLGLVIGMIIPALYMFISSFLNNKVEQKEDIVKGTDLPILGIVMHNKLKTEFPVLKFPHSGITESFRSVRTNLQYSMGVNSKVIAIQSMISGEGKSFVSLNLVLAFAMNNKRVLLVDGDMRKPQVHISFNDPNTMGLSSFLMKKNNFEEVVKESKVKNLSYVTAGPIVKNSAELLSSDNFNQFLNYAKSQFDLIVFNNSPISIVTDGKIIGSSADANIMVIRQNYSHIEHINAINEFETQGILKNISLVFNDVQVFGKSYGNGYYSDEVSKNKKKWKFSPSKELIS